jgi:23S rRNA U2552 (ribose-2'-O)-methylase RlmE/FtsJ
MEITIFKKNEIKQEFFENLFLCIYIDVDFSNDSCVKLLKEYYGNFRLLNDNKSKLDSLNVTQERYRNNIVKYLHEYELLEFLSKKQVISRSYFKLYEMIYHEPIILSNELDCFFICEAPGGFIDCVGDIRKKKNKHFDYLTTSVRKGITYSQYIDSDRIFYSDVTLLENIDYLIQQSRNKFPNGVDLITGDGGFNVKYFHAQEIITTKLIFSEILLSLSIQKPGGTFIVKVFDMFTHNTNMFYLLLCSCYSYVKIIKPRASRYSNSERYLVCYSFKGICNSLLVKLRRIHELFKSDNSVATIIFPDFSFGKNEFLQNWYHSKIKLFNNVFIQFQIKTIQDSIKMTKSNDLYFQNLLMKIFEKEDILNFKNILKNKIKKCIMFLKEFNINTNNIGYQLNGTNNQWI